MKKSLLPRIVKAIVLCFSLFFISTLFTQINAQNVTGKVFRDFDANGKQTINSPIEPTVGGVAVKAFNANGTQVGATATTLANGTYSIAVGTSSQVRIEFSNLPTSFYSGPTGLGSGTSVQFVNGGGTANFGINYPADFCGTSPKLVTPCYVNGTPLNGSSSANDPFIVTVPYTPTGNGTSGTTSENAYLSKGSEVGSTWGMAYQRSSKYIFTSALLKRHSGYGPGGPGAIYKIDVSRGTQITSLFVDLKMDLGIDVGVDSRNQASAADSLSKIKTQPNHDSTAFGNVGKVSLGGIDISDDEKTMWVINTFDKKLYELTVGSPAIKPTTTIVHTLPDPGCMNGVFRPWAIKFWRGKVYVGGVCTAENAGGSKADLKAYIYSFIPGDTNPNNFTQIITFPLNYPRGFASIDGTIQTSAAWKPWVAKWSEITSPAPGAGAFNQTICPQPILSDIEFDVDGSMVVGFMDRAGHQLGNKNYSPNKNDFLTYEGASAGDLLRIGFSNGVYTLENNATVNGIVSGGNNQSPSQGPGNGEFYWQDMFSKNANKNLPSLASGSGHQEISLGGLALLPGKNEVIESVFDPVSAPRAGGVVWFDNITGQAPRAYEIFGQDAGGQGATFGKANGLGDLELLCASQPIEVGNRIWNDTNKNGIQDAGEPVLTGITVELRKSGVLNETKTTNAITGEYYFTGLAPNSTDYEIRVQNVSGANKQSQLAGLTLTTAKVGTNNELDSDAIVLGTNTYASIAFKTGNAGENNHTLDIGFKCFTPTAKPGGQNVTICGGNSAFDLPDAKTGSEAETWTVLSSPTSVTATINSISGVVANMTKTGVYEFKLTNNATGCFETVLITVNAMVAAGANQSVCVSSATLTTPSKSQKWTVFTKPNGTNPQIDINGNVTGLTVEGIYTFRLTDDNTCFADVQITRTASPIAGADISTCKLTAKLVSAISGLQTWSAVTSPANPSPATIDANGNVNGMINNGVYLFELKSNGCANIVKVTKTIGVDVIAKNLSTCTGGIIQLTATSTTSSGVNYSWKGPSNFTSNQQNPAIANASPSNDGVYTVTASLSGCSATATVNVAFGEITVGTIPVPNLCAGQSLTMNATSSDPLATYAWTTNATTAFSAATKDVTLPNLTTGNSGTYTVLITNSNHCTSVLTANVVVKSIPTVSVTSDAFCEGSTGSLTASGASSYSWSGPSGAFTTTTATLSVIQKGVYLVTGNLNGCINTASTSVTVYPKTVLTATGAATCVGGNGTISVLPAGLKYAWAGPASFNSTLQTPLITNATDENKGIYTVTVTDRNTCISTATVAVTVGTTLTVMPSSNSPVCVGTRLDLSVLVGTGATYLWTSPKGTTTNIQNPFTLNASLEDKGIWTISVQNSDGCKGFGSVMIDVKPALVGLTATASVPGCTGDNISLTSSLTGAKSYEWSGTSTFTSSIQNPTIITPTANNYIFIVKVTNVDGCIATASASTAIYTAPAATATANSPVCFGSVINLGVITSGTKFAWSGPNGFVNSSQKPSILNAKAINDGVYTVVVTNTNSCNATATIRVTINSQLSGGNDLSICQPITTAQLTVTPGVTWLSNGTNPAIATVDANGKVSGMTINGTYVFTITNVRGCKDTVKVFRNEELDAGDDVVICSPKSTAKLLKLNIGQTWKYFANGSTLPMPTIDVNGNVANITQNGSYLFILEQEGIIYCVDTVAVTRRPSPMAGDDQTVKTGNGICEPSKTAKLQAALTGQTWTVASNSVDFGTVTIDASGAITKMEKNGIYTFVLTQGECIDSVKVERIAKPIAGVDVEICLDVEKVKLPNAPTDMTWSSISTNPVNTLINSKTGEVTGLTTVREYKFILKNLGGCTDTVSVKTKAIPTFNVNVVQGTCAIGTVNPDAKLMVSCTDITATYDYTEGLTYTGTKTFTTGTAFTTPVSGLANPLADKNYTVRVFNNTGCYTDKTVILKTRVCECKPNVCLPYSFRKTK